MHLRTGDRWHCTNPGCGASWRVESSSGIPGEGKNPQCSCGGMMKKHYSPPFLTYLDFLRLDESPAESRKVQGS